MEQNIADLLNDAFSDTVLPSYQEENLNFDGLNFDECDEERTESIGINWLPGLKEVDEDLEQMEETMEVFNSISGEECQWFLQNQCSGDIQNVGALADDVTVEAGNEDRDLKGDRDENDKQELRDSTEDEGDDDVQLTSNKERDSTEDECDDDVQRTSNKERDSTEDEGDDDMQGTSNKERDSTEDEGDDDVQETTNKERDFTEDKQEDVGMDDFGHSVYLSQVPNLKGQYLEEREEVTDYRESAQILFQDEQDIGGDENTMKITFSHVPPPHAEMQQEGRTTERLESKEEKKDEEEKEDIAGAHSGTRQFAFGLLSLGKDDFDKQFLEGLHHQLGGDLKEFSEDDQGVIGEDYAEYPSECFQQEDEDRKKEVGGIKTESTQETGKLEGNAPLEGDLSEWELLEKHTDLCKEHLPWKETVGDLLKENDVFVLEKITEEQGSEKDWLEEESMDMEEKDMGRHAEGERHVLEGTGALSSYSLSEQDNEELEDLESLKVTKGSESSEEEFIEGEHLHAHRQKFSDTHDESAEELQCKNKVEEVECGQENDGESSFSCAGGDGKRDFRELEERNDGYPGQRSLLETLEAWDTQTSGISFSGTDSDRSSEDSFSLSKPSETSSHPTTWLKDGTDPASLNISEQTEWLLSEASAPETKDFGYREERSWKTEMTPEELTSEAHNAAVLEPHGSFSFQNMISQEMERVGQEVTATDLDVVGEPEEEITTHLPSEHEAYSAVGVEEREFHKDDDEDEEVQERNWEQEKERIEAFYRYYNDDQYGAVEHAALNNSERKHTVRFCLQPNLPTDSSDMDDGVSSSSDEVEERDTPVTRMSLDFEEDNDGERQRQRQDFVLLLQQTQVTQREILKLSTELKAHRRKSKLPSPLCGCLKISLVTVLGVLFFWWATDQLEWMA